MSKVKMNFIYNTFYQVLLIVTPLITAPYISRVLGPTNNGIYSYTYSIVSYFVLISMLGLKNYGNRTIAFKKNDKKELSKTFWEIYFLQIITSGIMIISYFTFLIFFAKQYKLIFLIQSLYLFSSLLDISWFFFGMEEFKLTSIRSSIVKIASLLLIFIFVKGRNDLWIYCLIMAISMFAGQLTFWPFLRKFVFFYKPNVKRIFSHLKPNLLLFIPVIAVSLYNLMDIVMLGKISTMEETAFFQNAEKIVNIPFGIVTALGTVMLPRISTMVASGDTEKSKYYLGLSMQLVMFLSCALCFGIAGTGEIFAPIFFGSEFKKTGILIVLISPIILFKAWANVLRTQFLIPNSRDREYTISVVLGAVINVLLNIILIPRYMSIGATLATVAAEGIVCIYQTFVLRKDLPIKKYFRKSTPYLIIGFLMFLMVFIVGRVLDSSMKTLCIQVLLGGVFYLTSIYVYSRLTNDKLLKLL